MDEQFWEKFRKVKEHLGLANDSEVVRFVINYYFRTEVKEKEE